jgi:F-type H+-transporting ATPase subunit a
MTTERITTFVIGLLAVVSIVALTPRQVSAAEDGYDLDAVQHAADGVYLDFAPFPKVELPRIFLVRRADGSVGVDAFLNTTHALRSGNYALFLETAEGPGMMHDEAILAGMMDAGTHIYERVVPADGGSILIDFSITRHLVFAFLAGLLCLLIFIPLARRYARGIGRTSAPKGVFQNLMEVLVIFVRDEIAKPNIGHKYEKFMPYLLTAFFFILFANMLGLVPFGAAATSNIAITGVLAGFTFFITQLNGTRDYWMHIFWPPGVPVFVKLILIPVEILGLFTKPFALAIRLFANMAAGYLVILSLIGLTFTFAALFGPAIGWAVSPVSLALTLFIYALKTLVAFIQAYVFVTLSALFIGMAAEEHHHGEGHVPELGHDPGQVTPVVVDSVDQDLGITARQPQPA